MDALSSLLLNAQNNEMLRGTRVCQDSTRINHIFFTDDNLLFIRNKKEDVEIICAILHNFEEVSGQIVNLSKSLLYFSPNTSSNQRQELSNILGKRVMEEMDNYLGIPLLIKKNKTNVFSYIVNRFTNRIKGWSKRLLSLEGKRYF